MIDFETIEFLGELNVMAAKTMNGILPLSMASQFKNEELDNYLFYDDYHKDVFHDVKKKENGIWANTVAKYFGQETIHEIIYPIECKVMLNKKTERLCVNICITQNNEKIDFITIENGKWKIAYRPMPKMIHKYATMI